MRALPIRVNAALPVIFLKEMMLRRHECPGLGQVWAEWEGKRPVGRGRSMGARGKVVAATLGGGFEALVLDGEVNVRYVVITAA